MVLKMHKKLQVLQNKKSENFLSNYQKELTKIGNENILFERKCYFEGKIRNMELVKKALINQNCITRFGRVFKKNWKQRTSFSKGNEDLLLG